MALAANGEMLPPGGGKLTVGTPFNVMMVFLLNPLCSVRVCSAWLTGYDHPDIDKINQRIEDLTGLEIDTAEELQVRCCFWLKV